MKLANKITFPPCVAELTPITDQYMLQVVLVLPDGIGDFMHYRSAREMMSRCEYVAAVPQLDLVICQNGGEWPRIILRQLIEMSVIVEVSGQALEAQSQEDIANHESDYRRALHEANPRFQLCCYSPLRLQRPLDKLIEQHLDANPVFVAGLKKAISIHEHSVCMHSYVRELLMSYSPQKPMVTLLAEHEYDAAFKPHLNHRAQGFGEHHGGCFIADHSAFVPLSQKALLKDKFPASIALNDEEWSKVVMFPIYAKSQPTWLDILFWTGSKLYKEDRILTIVMNSKITMAESGAKALEDLIKRQFDHLVYLDQQSGESFTIGDDYASDSRVLVVLADAFWPKAKYQSVLAHAKVMVCGGPNTLQDAIAHGLFPILKMPHHQQTYVSLFLGYVARRDCPDLLEQLSKAPNYGTASITKIILSQWKTVCERLIEEADFGAHALQSFQTHVLCQYYIQVFPKSEGGDATMAREIFDAFPADMQLGILRYVQLIIRAKSLPVAKPAFMLRDMRAAGEDKEGVIDVSIDAL